MRLHLFRLLPALALGACQPQAARLLVLDLALSDPVVLESTAAPWHDAGYHVEYRRFYPHLTRQDLARYRTVIVLGGREPERRSDALTIGDLALLTEWVRRQGVVVLAYAGDGVGTLDRWVMNRWLAAQGAGIAIGTQPLEDTTTRNAEPPAVPQPASALDNAGFAPFPAGRNHVLLVRDASQALARTTARAFTRAPQPEPPTERPRATVVAASRVKEGLVLIASRNALAASGADDRTRDFLVALARWTRRPAEWAGVAPAANAVPLTLTSAPRPIAVHPPPLAPPPGAQVLVLPQRPPRVPPAAEARPVVPGWIARQGMRVLWTRFSLAAMDSVLRFADVAGLNALATVIPLAALEDTAGRATRRMRSAPRDVWQLMVERLQATSLRWFPTVALADFTSQGSDEVDLHGDLVPVPCALDSLFWRAAFRPTYRALARLGGARPDLIAGVALDLDVARNYYEGTGGGFCDADYREAIVTLRLDRGEIDRLVALPPTARYDALREQGLLDDYFKGLEAAVAERAITLRVELRRLHPDLRFAFRSSAAPSDWFSVGLLRGFSTREAPALLWTRERLYDYAERGVFVLSAVGLNAGRMSTRPVIFGQHDGFWLEGAATDSVGRLLRRLVR